MTSLLYILNADAFKYTRELHERNMNMMCWFMLGMFFFMVWFILIRPKVQSTEEIIAELQEEYELSLKNDLQ